MPKRLVWLRILKRMLTDPIESVRAILVIGKINRLMWLGKSHVVFYDRFAMHCTFSKPVIAECNQLGETVILLVGDLKHPARLDKNEKNHVLYMSSKMEIFLKFCKVQLIVTPASNFDTYSISKNTKLAHLFHSLVSTHYVYTDDAFDAYDIFFAVGPHQENELHKLGELRNWRSKKVYKSGYPRIDQMKSSLEKLKGYREHAGKLKRKVMFAPSWGEKNILRLHGILIIKSLLDFDFDVTLRPHKHSFDYDKDVLKEISIQFCDRDFQVDSGLGPEKILESDLLISDWSGVAYEYSFATERPVVFVDVLGAQKIQSEQNKEILVEPMEDVCRSEVGVVCKPSEVARHAQNIFSENDKTWKLRIIKIRKKYLFNYGASASCIGNQVLDSCKPLKMSAPPPTHNENMKIST